MDTIIFYMENKTEICVRNVEHWKFTENELSGKIVEFKIEYGEVGNAKLPYIDLDRVIAVKVIENK